MGVGEQASEIKTQFLSTTSVRLCLLISQYDKNIGRSCNHWTSLPMIFF